MIIDRKDAATFWQRDVASSERDLMRQLSNVTTAL